MNILSPSEQLLNSEYPQISNQIISLFILDERFLNLSRSLPIRPLNPQHPHNP